MSQTGKLQSWNRLIKGSVLVAWALGLVWLLAPKDGKYLILQFLHPDFYWLSIVGLAVVALFFLAVVSSSGAEDSDCSHVSSGFSLFSQSGLLIFPLLLLPLAVQSRFNANTLKIRSIPQKDLDALFADEPKGDAEKTSKKDLAGKEDQSNREYENDLEPRTLKSLDFLKQELDDANAEGEEEEAEVISFLDLDFLPEQYEGKRVILLGQFHRPESMPKGMFTCYRFVMNCCAADAMPLSVYVKYPDWGKVKDFEWMEVEGTVELRGEEGNQTPVLVKVKVEEADPPDELYIFR